MKAKLRFNRANIILSAIFIVAYCLALMLDGFGHSILAGGLLIVTAFSLYLAFAYVSRCPVDMRALLSLGWVFGLGLAIMRLSSYHFPWTFDSKICFGGFYVFYMLGGCFSREGDRERKPRSVNTDRMFYAILIMSALSLMTFIIEAIILGYIPIFSEDTHAYNYFHVTGLHYFTVSSIFTHCFTVTYALEMKKRGLTTQKNRKLLIAFANAVSVVINIMCLGKLNIMLSVASPVLIVLGQIKIADFKKLPWKKIIICVCAVAVLLVGVFVAFTKLRHYEPGYLDEIFSFRDASTPTYVQYPYMYIANNYANFNYLTMCIEQHSHGLKELFPVIALTGMKFVFPQLTAFPQYFMKIEMNTLTIIYDAYYDFAVPGVLVFGFIFGLVSRLITDRSRRRDAMSMLIFSQIAIYASLSFFSAWFTVPTTWFWIALTVMYGLFIRERLGKSHEEE
ncbi:MAG: oligosaccharide repeat unit polymerase [Lachnospiraceae bacterium]|nr:oligosaccharide repeat unit polymerase [Lachnospiraceae bacterium]